MVEFEYDGDRIYVPGEVDEILELIDIYLYIPFALVVASDSRLMSAVLPCSLGRMLM
jgi:hypothetical protein